MDLGLGDGGPSGFVSPVRVSHPDGASPMTAFTKLQQHFDGTDLGEPEDCWGMHIIRDKHAGTLSVHQIPDILALIDKYKPGNCQVLPMDPTAPLVAQGDPLEHTAAYSTVKKFVAEISPRSARKLFILII